MLPLLLMLVSDPLAISTPNPATRPEIRLRVIGDVPGLRCDGVAGFQRVERPADPSDLLRNDLSHPSSGEVRRYLLLDRSIRGCPAPISYALPDNQGGFIRDLAAPAVRPPVRRPPEVQPPRSSE